MPDPARDRDILRADESFQTVVRLLACTDVVIGTINNYGEK